MSLADRLLFEIVCSHEYVGGQACRALNLTPSPACAALLRRYGWQFRALPGGAAVYGPAIGSGLPLQSFDEAGPLIFWLRSADPDLLSYTDIAVDGGAPQSDGIYYFDNRDSGALPLLHPPGQPFHEGQLRVCAPRFRYLPASCCGMLGVRTALGGQLVWNEPAPVAGQTCTIDMSNAPEARYSLFDGDTRLFDFFASGLFGQQPLGVVAIYMGGQAQALADPAGVYPIDVSGAARRPRYRIELAARRCRWRYMLVARNAAQGAPVGSVVAVDDRKPISGQEPAGKFSVLAGDRDVDGLPAAAFVSAEPLPLLATPDSRLAYQFRPGGNGMQRGEALILPYAGPQLLGPGAGDGTGLCADIYVYF